MGEIRVVGDELTTLPWQPRPEGFEGVVWRHPDNPIIGWNPTPRTARVFNSAVVPFGDGFAGVFRADHRHGKPFLLISYLRDNSELVDGDADEYR